MVAVSITWRGDEVSKAVVESTMAALHDAAHDGEEHLRSATPVRTGFLRDSSYAIVDISDERRPVLIFGQKANYALFVELGTRFMTGHYQLTQTGMFVFPQLQSQIAAQLGQRGYGGSTSIGSTGAGVANPSRGGRLGGVLPAAVREAPLNP